MKIIGVTGPSGSGKTILTEYFAERGITTVDADKLYHSMLIPPSRCLDEIFKAFGSEVFNPDGSLDRAALSGVVFSDPEKLRLLNSTVLRLVLDEIRVILARLKENGEKAVIIDAPTLIESGFDKECDVVISVISNRERRIARISERDSISEQKARERVLAQKDDEFYRAHSHHVIYNDGTRQEFIDSLTSLQYLFD